MVIFETSSQRFLAPVDKNRNQNRAFVGWATKGEAAWRKGWRVIPAGARPAQYE